MTNNVVFPNNLDAEISVLASVINDNKVLPLISQIIEPDDFYKKSHSLIFTAMLNLNNNKTEITLISLQEELNKNQVLSKIGGIETLTSFVSAVFTSLSWEYHSNLIKEKSQRRKIIKLGLEYIEKAQSEMYQVDEILSDSKNAIINIDRDKTISDTDNEKLAMDTYNGIFAKKEPGLYTGIQGIGRRFYFEEGYIHCVAAESGIGKSAWLLQMADFISKTYGKKVPYYSLESTKERLLRRQICRDTQIPLSCINNNDFRNDNQIKDIQDSCENFCQSNLKLFDDSTFIYIERLISHAESYYLNNDVAMICIDFLQALDSVKQFSSDRSKINYFINRIKSLAKNLNVPVVYACQLRKDINGRPKLDDLIESNYIRTHTDNILFLWSPDSDPIIYPVECFLAKGKEQERFSTWLEFNGNFQIFYKGEKPLELFKKNKTWKEIK